MPCSQTGRHAGSNNHMSGIRLYDLWLSRCGKNEADKRLEDWKKKVKHEGKSNGMAGRSVYSVWLKKYGKEEADKRMSAMKEKHRKNASGTNNHMYGKPSPIGSGNGWSGWYRGHYFRSLLELSYMLNLDAKNIPWQTAESKEFQIEYNLDGKKRTYHPDFYLLNTDELIEIKPKRLLNSRENLPKFEAARKSFRNFRVVSETAIKDMSFESIKKLCESGTVKLVDKWKERLASKIEP